MSRLITFFLHLILGVASLGVAIFAALNYTTATRGVEPRTTAPIIGTNVALDQYASATERARALDLVKGAGLTAIRQHFAWREIEATRRTFAWAKWDEIVSQTRAANLQIVTVLDTTPTWAQREYERALPNAPPDDFANYAHFTGEFARRYGTQIDYYEIWDEPNVHPNWGQRNADPAEYARLLRLAAEAIRANDAHAKIVLAGLGMNLETQRPHPDYSEILFLRGLYEAGAQNDFDIVAAKPYGMWTGPEDRRVSTSVLNFSRVILLRDEMKAHGDANKPLWAVEMGWNALPQDWTGTPSPWGSDSETMQADRLTRALTRARDEWGWMGALFPQVLQSHVPANDPHWGFALVTRDSQPRAAYNALATFVSSPPPVAPLASAPIFSHALLALVALIALWRGARLVPHTQMQNGWHAFEIRFTTLPEFMQFALLAFAAAAFYFSPNVLLNFVLLTLLVLLFALRLDLGLTLLVFTISFFLFPKTLFGGFEMSLVEVLTLVSVAAWGLQFAILSEAKNLSFGLDGDSSSQRTLLRMTNRVTSLDWAIIVFVLLGILSTRVAENFGVAMRELRVIVIEPALLYALLRVANPSRAQIGRLVNALLLAGVVVCISGLAQFALGDVIVGAGVRRVRAVWGSPNNAALFLGRLLPVALALALFLKSTRRRWIYAAGAALFAVTILLTYSLGALVFGIPMSVGFIALVWLFDTRGRARISRAMVLGALLGVVIVAVAFVGSARFQTLFQSGTGTGFFRVAVWTSSLNMIRDHPLWGVGLDNFLYEYPKYILPEAWREPNLSHPHNIILDFWLRLGVLGVGVLLWIEIEFFRRAWRVFRATNDLYTRALVVGLLASMLDLLAHGMIDAAYFVVDLAFVFMLTVGLLMRLAREQTIG